MFMARTGDEGHRMVFGGTLRHGVLVAGADGLEVEAGVAVAPRGQVEAAAQAGEAPAEDGDMNADEMISLLRDEAVLAAIRVAESNSSGEVRVFVTTRRVHDPVAEAWTAFAKLQMQQTRQRNAVLVLIAPNSRTFVIVGDEGIHQYCKEGVWNHLVDELAAGFRKGEYTDAIVRVIEEIGEVLARHFPYTDDDHNELPDDIVRE